VPNPLDRYIWLLLGWSLFALLVFPSYRFLWMVGGLVAIVIVITFRETDQDMRDLKVQELKRRQKEEDEAKAAEENRVP
jgi:hypothetical protein